MLAEVGVAAVGLALATVLYATLAAGIAARRDDPRWAESARNGVLATAALLGFAVLLLVAAFLNDRFEVRYVAQHSSRSLPLYLKISALWAGQEGSLLLWSFLQALFAALALNHRLGGRTSPDFSPTAVRWAAVFLNLTTAFFAGVTLFLSNPFVQTAVVPADGAGLNPLLRHPGMVFHPPTLYLGYVGLAVPYAFAMAALITGEVEDWTRRVRRWTLAAWLFLGLGLLLGARWAYDVLGWGGYWAWDPVENAGLMPWLTATALLHGGAMQEERRGFRLWNVLLVAASFTLVLFGTFTTRSGMIQSVHAFARSDLGPYFIAAILLVLVGSLALIVHRRRLLTGPSEGAFLSREGMFTLALLLFTTFTVSVLVGTLLPTLTEALTGDRFEASPEWFDRVTAPQLAALLLILAFCALADRRLARLRGRSLRELWPGALGAVLVVGLAALAGFTDPLSLLGFFLIGMAAGTAIGEVARDVAARVRREEGPLQAFWALADRNRRKYGGYIVHLGILLLTVGLIGTRMYPLERDLTIVSREPVRVGRYTLVFEELRQDLLDDRLVTWAVVQAYQGDRYLVTLQPRLEQYITMEQTVTTPALRAGLREDLYIVLAGWTAEGTAATFTVYVNPLASFLWLGGLVFLAGGALAFWPPAPERLSVPQRRRRRVWNAVALTAGLLVLMAAGLAMWGPGHGAVVQSARRPIPGQAAPDFTLTLLDGSTITLSGLRGQVVVVNFWASWCPPCEEETPDLQAVWEEYQGRGVAFVGIAYKDDEPMVRDFIARYGVTYLIGLDLTGDLAARYGLTGVPETFVVGPDGRVAAFYIGPVTAEQLRADLDGLLP